MESLTYYAYHNELDYRYNNIVIPEMCMKKILLKPQY